MDPMDRPPPPLSTLRRQLAALGLGPGDTVMVHASMRAVGPVQGRADGLIDALEQTVGPRGAVMMLICADPETPFDPATSPAWDELGVLAEVFRRRPRTVLNTHPIARFGACGHDAQALVEAPLIDDYYGPGSPLERLWAAGGKVLRLGADPDTVTLLHHAEYRATLPTKRRITHTVVCATPDGPRPRQVSCLDDEEGIVDWPDGDDYFAEILQQFLAAGRGRRGLVGAAQSECLDARAIIDFGRTWMETYLTR